MDVQRDARHLHHRWRDLREDLRRRLAVRLIGDRDYLSALYRRKFGRTPNLDRPRGFNEKIIVKILNDRRRYLTLFSDKLRVRAFVRQATRAVSLTRLHWWSPRAEGLPFGALPDAFALKANHGSGWNALVRDKSQVRRQDLVDLARAWLRSDFTIVGREWSYRDVHRAVFAEELLRRTDGSLPPDYKLFVFNGKVRVIQVDEGRFTRHTQVLYDEQWNRIDGTVAASPGTPSPPPPTLTTMIEAAEALSLGVDFVRADFYDDAGRIVFGELTNSPNKGLSPFDPPTLDARLGEMLVLDDYRADGPSIDYEDFVRQFPLVAW